MFHELITNNTLIAPLFSWAIAQLLKTFVALLQKKQFEFRYLVSSGGMPSSHSALVTSLATAVAFSDGLGSVTFGISVILAFVVMHDAAGVRHSVGQQAAILNRILKEIGERHPVKVLGRDFKVLVGHTPFQVVIGGLLGIGIAWLWITLAGT
jgi:acid phosphatase family membrane protein YuiD